MVRESAENCHVPNAGFLEDVVFEDPALSLSGRASDSSEVDPSVDPGNMISNEDMREAIDADTASSSVGQPSTTQNDGADEITLQLTSDLSELKVAETYADESNTEGQHSLCVEEVDALLDKCLLQALHTTIKEKDLPIPGSTFWYDSYQTFIEIYLSYTKIIWFHVIKLKKKENLCFQAVNLRVMHFILHHLVLNLFTLRIFQHLNFKRVFLIFPVSLSMENVTVTCLMQIFFSTTTINGYFFRRIKLDNWTVCVMLY